jgi:hypothetical protein
MQIIIIIIPAMSVETKIIYKLIMYEFKQAECNITELQFTVLLLDWNDGLHNFFSWPSKIRMIKSRRIRWLGHAARLGEKRNAYRIVVGKPEGKRSLGRQRRRWVDNIKTDPREKRRDCMD